MALMPTILTTIDHPDIILPDKDITVYDYYINTIQPYLVRRGYQPDYKPCQQVWETLLQQPTDIVLMFLMINVEWENSCCVQLARRIYREWPLASEPPIRMLHFEWDYSEDMAEVAAAFHIPRPEEPLYYVIDNSRWDAEYIANWIDIKLTQHSFDLTSFQEQVQALLTPPNTAWSLLHLENLAYYHLVLIKTEQQSEEQILTYIWDRERTLHPLDGGLSQFIDLVDKSSLQLIFHLKHIWVLFINALQKHIIHLVRSPDEPIHKYIHGFPAQFRGEEYVTYADLLPADKRDLLRHYAATITTLKTWHNEQEQQAQFWAIDALTSTLEKWLFIQRGGKFSVHSDPQGHISLEDFGLCLSYTDIPYQNFNTVISISDEPFVPPEPSS
jgi:hypothetical protein